MLLPISTIGRSTPLRRPVTTAPTGLDLAPYMGGQYLFSVLPRTPQREVEHALTIRVVGIAEQLPLGAILKRSTGKPWLSWSCTDS